MSKGQRCWNFMTPNWTQEDIDSLSAVPCKYMIYGKEVAPTTGMPHLQGFVQFTDQKTMSAVQKVIRGHLTAVTSRPWDCIEYCKKEGDWTERGKPPTNPGKRERDDWTGYVDLIKEGRACDLPEKIYITQFRNIQAIEAKYRKVDTTLDGDFVNEWIWGPPGTGKSRTARAENPGCFIKSHNKWWDGYQQEDVVLIDDVDSNWQGVTTHLKTWADRYSFPAEIKGGSMPIRPKKIVVTSNYCIQAFCEKLGADSVTMQAVFRRFTERYMGVEQAD